MSDMEKGKKNKKAPGKYRTTPGASKVHEMQVHYLAAKQPPVVKDFNYKEFKKITGKVPFTQQEWAEILHISERTLQRYAKANSIFPFSITDRVLQINKVIKRGIEVFGSLEKFMSWLRSCPFMLEGNLSIKSLKSIDGINLVLTQLGRIEHGLFA